MRHFTHCGLLAASLLAFGGAHAAVDTVEAPDGFFAPGDAEKTNAPYYRYAADSWGWAQGAVPGSFSSASLNISAFDVDASAGEIDQIYAMDNGQWILLGALAGNPNVFAFTTFNLGSNFFDDINIGLQVRIDIDVQHENWAVALAKSTLLTDGSVLPPVDPDPPAIPEPQTYALMLGGLALVGAASRWRRR